MVVPGSLVCVNELQYLLPSGQFSKLELGLLSGCALATDQTVWCFRAGAPAYVPNPTKASDLCVGTTHGCAVAAATGSLFCWGSTFYGESTPLPGPFVAVSCGAYFTCARRADGSVACFGQGAHGELNVSPIGSGPIAPPRGLYSAGSSVKPCAPGTFSLYPGAATPLCSGPCPAGSMWS